MSLPLKPSISKSLWKTSLTSFARLQVVYESNGRVSELKNLSRGCKPASESTYGLTFSEGRVPMDSAGKQQREQSLDSLDSCNAFRD